MDGSRLIHYPAPSVAPSPWGEGRGGERKRPFLQRAPGDCDPGTKHHGTALQTARPLREHVSRQ
jgi:hypothetical protein